MLGEVALARLQRPTVPRAATKLTCAVGTRPMLTPSPRGPLYAIDGARPKDLEHAGALRLTPSRDGIHVIQRGRQSPRMAPRRGRTLGPGRQAARRDGGAMGEAAESIAFTLRIASIIAARSSRSRGPESRDAYGIAM